MFAPLTESAKVMSRASEQLRGLCLVALLTVAACSSDAGSNLANDRNPAPSMPEVTGGFCEELGQITSHWEDSAAAVEAAEGDAVRQFAELFAAAGDIHIFLRRLADVAPSDIQADLEALAAASEPNFAGAASDPVAALVGQLATSLATANAAQRVEEYALGTCGQPVFGEIVLNAAVAEASPRRNGEAVVVDVGRVYGEARCDPGFIDPGQSIRVEQDVLVVVCEDRAFAIDLGSESLAELWHQELPGDPEFWDLRGDSFVVSWQEEVPPEGLTEELVTQTVASFDLRSGMERWSQQLIGPESPHAVQSVEHVRFGVALHGLGPDGEVVLTLPTGDAIREGAFEGEPSALVVLGGDTGEELWRGPELAALDFEGARSGLVAGRPDLVFRRFDSPTSDSSGVDIVTLFETASGDEVLRQDNVYGGDIVGAECSPFVMLGDVASSAGEGYWAVNTDAGGVFMVPLQPKVLTPAGLLSLEYLGFDEGDALTMFGPDGERWRLEPEVFTDWEYAEGLLVVENPNGNAFEVNLSTGETIGPWTSYDGESRMLLPEHIDSGWSWSFAYGIVTLDRWEHERPC